MFRCGILWHAQFLHSLWYAQFLNSLWHAQFLHSLQHTQFHYSLWHDILFSYFPFSMRSYFSLSVACAIYSLSVACAISSLSVACVIPTLSLKVSNHPLFLTLPLHLPNIRPILLNNAGLNKIAFDRIVINNGV